MNGEFLAHNSYLESCARGQGDRMTAMERFLSGGRRAQTGQFRSVDSGP